MADAPHHLANMSGYGAAPHAFHAPATPFTTAAVVAESLLAVEYRQEVHRLAEKASRKISQLEQDATEKARQWAQRVLAEAHQWQSTVMTPDFQAKLARGDPQRVQTRLSLLQRDLDDMQLDVPLHWVCECSFFHS